MEATAHSHSHHAPMPSSGRALNLVAVNATLHCLTGCAIGEVAGMLIGTALGFSNLGTIAISVVLAFVFGYSLTSLPLLRAGMALAAVVPIALATDTFSIATMEVVDNLIMVAVPGAMHAGLGDILFWGALSFALAVAGVAAFPVNRWLITRGKGHAVLHQTGIHGGPNLRIVGAAVAVAAVFGTVVLVNEAVSSGGGGHDGMSGHAMQSAGSSHGGHGRGATGPDEVRGLAVAENGLKLELASTAAPRGRRSELRFRIVGEDGRPVRDFEIEHTKRMHFIVVRRDLSGFQHLHPRMDQSGTWRTALTLDAGGSYRVFADFKRDDRNQTLASDVAVDGAADYLTLPPTEETATTSDGYQVSVDAANARAGKEANLKFDVTRAGKPVRVEPYLGARGHLVALRQGDLAYLHVHPTEGEPDARNAIGFATEFPSDGNYRLFLQFKHEGRVHTAAFTQEVSR